MATVEEQTAILEAYLLAEDYPGAYNQMALWIREDPAWDPAIADWMETAARINGPDETDFWKRLIFDSNAVALGVDPDNPLYIDANQAASDALARNVIEDYLDAINTDTVVTPADIFHADVGGAVSDLGLHPWQWAGGPLGAWFHFPVEEVYDQNTSLLWALQMLRVLPELGEDYTGDALNFLKDSLTEIFDNFVHDINKSYDDNSYYLKDISDLLRNLLSDPIVLDLDGDGIELVALTSSSTMFDIDEDGVAERVGWTSPQDGFLVLDANTNGLADGIEELFGSQAVDGYDELALLDTNHDGKIDSGDTDFAKLMVWRDLNSDGVSTSDEMLTLAQANIARFNLSYSQVNSDSAGNVVARLGSYVRTDTTTRAMGSVKFALDETTGLPAIPTNADVDDLLMLPNLPGLMALPNLRTAMYYDATLKGMVDDLVFGEHDFDTFLDFMNGGFEDVLFRWAGIDNSEEPGPGEPSLHLQLIMAFTGSSLGDLNTHQLGRIEGEIWPALVKKLGVQFLFSAVQSGGLKAIFELHDGLEGLSTESPTFAADFVTLVNDAADTMSADPAYDYLKLFEGLDFNPATGEISGDFDAFVAKFIEDQPAFTTFFASSGGGRPHGGTSVVLLPDPEHDHSWQAWYQNQGQLLYYIAEAMGINSDYVNNVTGWRWLMIQQGEVEGTSGSDILDVTSSSIFAYSSTWSGTSSSSLAVHDHRFFGFEGNDELRGNDGVDSLIGGTGDDLLKGGSGSDMYVYALGDGLDRIIDTSGAADAIYFSSEFDRANLQVSLMSGTSDFLLHFGNQSAGIILQGQWSSSAGAIEEVHFVGEDGLNAGEIASIYLASLASSGNDTITGSWADEHVIGLEGNDTLSGGNGNDWIDGGAGADTLNGNDGNDTVDGGDGADILNGGRDNDVLQGGAGNDILTGWSGNDIYMFNLGGGQDVIQDYWDVGSGGSDTVVFGGGIAPEDLIVTQINLGTDLLLSISGTTDSVLLDNSINNSDYRIEQVQFEGGASLTHAQLMALSYAPTSGNDTFYGAFDADIMEGGAGNDTLNARAGNDTLIGGTGNDTLTGWEGNDTYVFNLGDGQDTISDFWDTGSAGTDTVLFGTGIALGDIVVTQVDGGNDLLITIAGTTDSVLLNQSVNNADYRIEKVQFADGTVLTHAQLLQLAIAPTSGNDTFYGSYDAETVEGGAGNDNLNARAGNDTLIGGTGNDILTGWSGNDTYVFNLGDGQDTISDYWDASSGGSDTVLFGAGIAPGDIVVTQVDGGNDLLISITGTTDSVLLNQSVNNSDYRIEQVQFANGTILTHAQLLALATAPTSGDDTFYGSYDVEIMEGGAGNDTLNARGGNDTLIGGTGNDVLTGWSGNDTYAFNLGDGQDTVSDYWDSGSGGSDTVLFGSGIASGDIIVTQADGGNDLLLSIAGTSDSVLLNNTVNNSDYRIEQIQFASGTVLTHAQLLALSMTSKSSGDSYWGTSAAETIAAGDRADTVYGRAGNDTLYGDGGDDLLYGEDGVDTLYGGTGNDILSGGAGNDTYAFGLGDGQDIIRDGSGGTDTVLFGSGIASGDIIVTQADNGNDILVSISGTTDSVLLDDTVSSATAARIENVQFSGGTILTHAQLVTLSISAKATADTYWGTTGVDTISGGDGADTLYGRAGNDTLSGDNGDDFLYGEDGIDTLYGGDGNDTIQGGNQNDAIYGGLGVDTLTGGANNDTFWFGAGETGVGASADLITDFVKGTDKINLSAIDANSGSGGDQAFSFIGSAAFSNTAGQLRFEQISGSTWLRADVDGDGVSDLDIVLTGTISPTATDFVL